jgi:uncharacterized protein (TIGR02284 family)
MSENKEVTKCLNDLIRTCKDGEQGFREAAIRVGQDGKSQLRTILNLFSQQRARFAADLQTEVLRRGADPAEAGHVSATLRRGWTEFKSELSAGPDYNDDYDYEFEILSNCVAGETAAMETYGEILRKQLPADVVDLVQSQYLEIRQGHDQLNWLSTEYKRAEEGVTH